MSEENVSTFLGVFQKKIVKRQGSAHHLGEIAARAPCDKIIELITKFFGHLKIEADFTFRVACLPVLRALNPRGLCF